MCVLHRLDEIDEVIIMAQPAIVETGPMRAAVKAPSYSVFGAFHALHWGLVILPLVMGIDTFTHVLTNWDKYIAPIVPQVTKLSLQECVTIFGVVNILLALLIAVRPRSGAYLLALWLAAGIVSMAQSQTNLDVAFKDFILMLGAIALGQLSKEIQDVRRAATVPYNEPKPYPS
jgi:hypothetical protein